MSKIIFTKGFASDLLDRFASESVGKALSGVLYRSVERKKGVDGFVLEGLPVN